MTRSLRANSDRRGFSLVEIMVVVAIISLLCMMALPAFARLKMRARSTVIVQDLRVFSQAFDQYAQETGGWPPDAAAGVLPPLMAGRLNAAQWTRTTPIGGKYNWEYNQMHFGTRYTAAISIAAATGAPLPLDVNQLIDLDRTIDDGDLLHGNLRIGSGLVPLWIITP
jgi:prepilin-type N-terminal cleavage/methylation domain-containing protein